MSAGQLERRCRLVKILRDLASAAYWYGEETGDYDMHFVGREDFFQDAVAALDLKED